MVNPNVTSTVVAVLPEPIRQAYYGAIEYYWNNLHNNNNDAYVWTAVIVYLGIVFLLPKILTPIYGTSLYTPLNVFTKVFGPIWNLGLTLFSLLTIIGFFDVWFGFLTDNGLANTLCDENEHFRNNKVSAFWNAAFAYSKFFELVDTVFLIVKNPTRKVAFLHWYHHFTVLLFCWFANKWLYPSGIVFLFINAFVHTVMYAYYFCKEIGITPPGAIVITILQIVQMFAGIAVNAHHAHMVYVQKRKCGGDNIDLIIGAAFLMYASYLVLFVRFFVNRYISGSSKPRPAKGEKAKSQ